MALMDQETFKREIMDAEAQRFQNLVAGDSNSLEVLFAELEPDLRGKIVDLITETIAALSYPDVQLLAYACFMAGMSMGRRLEGWSRDNFEVPDALPE